MQFAFDIDGAGIGDICFLSWISTGANVNSRQIVYLPCEKHSTLLRVLGQPIDDANNREIVKFANGGNCYQYELRIRGTRIPKTYMWQKWIPIRCKPRRPIWSISEQDHQWAEKMFDWVCPDGRPMIVIAPYATATPRNWPRSKYMRLAWGLEQCGFGVLAIDGDASKIDKFPKYAAGYDMAKISALLLRSEALVGNDSGMAHLAGTLGVKSFPIMGPTDPICVFGYAPEFHPISIEQYRVPCVGCHFEAEKGFSAACDIGCEALNCLGWQEVMDKVIACLRKEDSNGV